MRSKRGNGDLGVFFQSWGNMSMKRIPKGEDKNWWLSGGGGVGNRQVRAVSHYEPGVDSVAGAQG